MSRGFSPLFIDDWGGKLPRAFRVPRRSYLAKASYADGFGGQGGPGIRNATKMSRALALFLLMIGVASCPVPLGFPAEAI